MTETPAADYNRARSMIADVNNGRPVITGDQGSLFIGIDTAVEAVLRAASPNPPAPPVGDRAVVVAKLLAKAAEVRETLSRADASEDGDWLAAMPADLREHMDEELALFNQAAALLASPPAHTGADIDTLAGWMIERVSWLDTNTALALAEAVHDGLATLNPHTGGAAPVSPSGEPALWGLFNPVTGRFRCNVFSDPAKARQAAAKGTDNYTELVAVPLYSASTSPLSGEGWKSLSCDEQRALAERIASNVGYVLVPEPPHPDSPHTRADAARDGEVVEALRMAERFIVKGIAEGYISFPASADPDPGTLEAIRAALATLQGDGQ